MVLRLDHSKPTASIVCMVVAGAAFVLHGCEINQKGTDTTVDGTAPAPSPNGGSVGNGQRSQKWWLRAAAMQTISPSCYSMTLSDLYNYLDTLKENGVYTLTLNAVYDHGSGYNEKEPSGEHSLWCGLAISDPLNVNSVFGSEAEFDKFVKTAHDKGMKVMSWFNPSYWWTGSPHIKKAEQDLKRHGHPDNVKGSEPDSPALWFDWKSGNPGKSKPPDNAPGSKGRSVAGDSQPGGWVWDDDAGFAYWSKWAFQPTTNFGSDAWQRKYEDIAKYWIQERKVDGFTYDDPHGYYKVDQFKEKNADLMRTLSADSFFQNAEIYGDPHVGLEFGMDSVLPASWGEDKEIFIWIADKIKRGDMNGLDDLLGKYYDKFARANQNAGELVTYPWMRQMVDPFGKSNKAKNAITRAVTVAAGFLAVTEKTEPGDQWEDQWWAPTPYTGTGNLKDLATAMESCDAFNHGTIRERITVSGGTQKQYAIMRYFVFGSGGGGGCDKTSCFKGQCSTCGERIAWVQDHEGLSWQDAASKVAREFPDGTCDACVGLGNDDSQPDSSSLGFAIFNFDDREVTFSVQLPQRLQNKKAMDCVTRAEINPGTTFEVTLGANQFQLFQA